jgi:hypothetical protein
MTQYRRLADGLRTNISEANRPPNVVSSAPQSTTEGRPMDIADFSDELAELVQEALDSGIEVSEVKATLHAKLAELDAGQALGGSEDNDNGEEEPGENP